MTGTTLTDSVDRIRAELEGIGYKTSAFEWSRGVVVSFDYTIEIGSHRGRTIKLGVSFQETGYPEYPPHWIHVSPEISDGKGGAIESHTDPEGRKWIAMSRPPGALWDQLPTKHMGAFMNEHVRRIWKDL